jgi:hypothetical protein
MKGSDDGHRWPPEVDLVIDTAAPLDVADTSTTSETRSHLTEVSIEADIPTMDPYAAVRKPKVRLRRGPKEGTCQRSPGPTDEKS